jgi:hypothetical protein
MPPHPPLRGTFSPKGGEGKKREPPYAFSLKGAKGSIGALVRGIRQKNMSDFRFFLVQSASHS